MSMCEYFPTNRDLRQDIAHKRFREDLLTV